MTISASCRPAPASATRSTWNIFRRPCGRRRTSQARRQADVAEIAYPDTLVGTDSHTTMVNGLSVLGWGVGGIEAEAAMLGQPYSMLLPEVIGVRLTGKLREGVTATDLVLTVTQMLRKRGVVGKFVDSSAPASPTSRSPIEPPSAICRPNTAPPAGFFRSTTTRYAISQTPAGPQHKSRWSRPMPRRKACTVQNRPRTPSSPTCSSSIWRKSSLRSPARSARRIASRSRRSNPASPSRWRRNSTKGAALAAARMSSIFTPRWPRRPTRASPRPARPSAFRSKAARTISVTATSSLRRSPPAPIHRTPT